MSSFSQRELLSLVEALCEETATPGEIARLEELVLSDLEARRLYVEAITLHGLLHWDAAGLGAETESAITQALTLPPQLATFRTSRHRESKPPIPFRRMRAFITGIAVLVILKLGFSYWNPGHPQLAQNPQKPLPTPSAMPHDTSDDAREVPDVHLPSGPRRNTLQSSLPGEVEPSIASMNPGAPVSTFELTSDDAVVSRINELIESRWKAAGVTPSPRASDAEWVRRTYLDLVGRIPTVDEAESYFRDQRTDKQQRLVDDLLERREFARHLSTVWTNLLVGRARKSNIDRMALAEWLEDEFAADRPWKEIVTDLIAARGTPQESGPANYLLAHLNNEAVPATAITARIFLCEQLQCAQCHQHPIVKDWGQERFWELNAFFQQAKIQFRKITDARTGKSRETRELIDVEQFGPSYYETLRGVMRVAYPRFAGVEIESASQESDLPLRERLAELLFAESQPQAARAFVNRTWAQLMGYGFTFPVDDMGPHNPVSHPELLEDLTAAFVQSGYDVRRLIRWICLSEPYQLSSGSPRQNPRRRPPEEGELPLFASMAVKNFSPEQLYDSLRIASGDSPRILGLRGTERQREEWLRLFYSANENEENSESSTFDGSISQALIMMNGDLVNQALSLREGNSLGRIVSANGLSEAERIRAISLVTLSRYPTQEEQNQLRDLLRRSIRQRVTEEGMPTQVALAEGLRDIFWAYLNSSEFTLIR